MSTGSHGPQQLIDRKVQTRVHRQRDELIAAIREDDVCRLASSHHGGDYCSFFKPPVRGSYNICYFVRFPNACSNDVDKWVVRVPLAPCLAEGSRSKLEREIASMQVMKKKTTIPVPKIYAYNLGDGSQPLSSYIIIEYIEGQVFSHARLKALSDEQRKLLYISLADIYIQLRRLEYPSIGCLVHGSEGFTARKRIATIDINMQALEGLQPFKIQSSFYGDRDFLTSANDYVAMLLELADNAFAAGRNSVSERELGEEALYHLHIFREYVESWIDYRLDQGPFVLVHGDLEPFNLIVDDNMNILSVLDWEWSRVVPIQFFKPPLWFKNPDTTCLAYNFVYQDYIKSFNQFLDIVRTRERKKYGNELLSDEWAKAKDNSGFLVANALENWTDIDWFAHRYINWKCYKGKGELSERVKAFMLQDPARKALIEQKVQDYRVEANSLEDTSSGPASANTDEPASVNAAMKYFFLHRLWKNTIDVSPTIAQMVLGGVIFATGTLYLLVKRTQVSSRLS